MPLSSSCGTANAANAAASLARAGRPLRRSIVLVGLMGAGKTSVGRRLAKMLGARFADADEEIVAAAGMSIPEIFACFGEPKFRELERRVISRLLESGPMVLALGGGAFVDAQTRDRVKAVAVSVWLRADLETLVVRTGRRRGVRPLLAGAEDPRSILDRLMRERYPIYAEADHVVESSDRTADLVAERVLAEVAGKALVQ
jgi:shikimate kinase